MTRHTRNRRQHAAVALVALLLLAPALNVYAQPMKLLSAFDLVADLLARAWANLARLWSGPPGADPTVGLDKEGCEFDPLGVCARAPGTGGNP